LETFITQREKESSTLAEGYEQLAKVLGVFEEMKEKA